ncbi:hypothetical protein Y032_0036g3171 [Ancylostoma ceylanicum]|uniref:Uncharacterized protein n=1 Tax=Ancylostoma ceylanicum TaxID=53326 RepID=A0A016UJW8_9BILA|nr:hypothetical protein Y032_0036g3171 [Ancylostoma ceylanicum]
MWRSPAAVAKCGDTLNHNTHKCNSYLHVRQTDHNGRRIRSKNTIQAMAKMELGREHLTKVGNLACSTRSDLLADMFRTL